MTDQAGLTYYDILGVEPDAPQEKVRAIYRLRSRRVYPRRPGTGNATLQRQLNEAYAVLKDPKERAAYNQRIGLSVKPRALLSGRPIFAEIKVTAKVARFGGRVAYTLSRWEPCGQCWSEGCDRCQGRGATVKPMTIKVRVPAGAKEVLVEGQGAISEPGGERGDLILYVVVDETGG